MNTVKNATKILRRHDIHSYLVRQPELAGSLPYAHAKAVNLRTSQLFRAGVER
jgi:hypothetical protein